MTDIQWFCRNVPKGVTADECWNWQGTMLKNGYGQIAISGTSYRPTASRFAYDRFVAPVVPGMHVDHLCRNRRCVNPSHLEMVTHRENMLRGIGAPAINASKTHCVHGHPLSGDNLYKGQKHRICRACCLRRMRTAYQKRKARAARA